MDGVIEANLYVGLVVASRRGSNGIAVVRAYCLLFTGTRHVSSVSLGITPRERFAVLTLAALILGGGLFPQPGVQSRHLAAEAVCSASARRRRSPTPPPRRRRGTPRRRGMIRRPDRT